MGLLGTQPGWQVGEALAGKLVEAKLAACVNILPGVTSIYFWDGKVGVHNVFGVAQPNSGMEYMCSCLGSIVRHGVCPRRMPLLALCPRAPRLLPQVNNDAELLLIIKSREDLLPELTAFVKANHPYDEPEVIGLPILGGSPSYLQWLMDSTNKGAPAQQAQQAQQAQ